MENQHDIDETKNIETSEESKDEDVRAFSKPRIRRKKQLVKSAPPKAVKYRMTFIVSRPFQGGMYKKGDVIIVEEHIKTSYEHRINEFKFDAE